VVKITREKWKTHGGAFDEFTDLNLKKLASRGFFDELVETLKPGKEANVFTALKQDGSRVVVKIYRLENCNFNKMYEYISQDPRYSFLKGHKRKIIFAWTQREYRNLLKARDVIRVPSIYAFKDNILVMECITEDGEVAPLLKDVKLKNATEIFEEIISNVDKLFKKGLVHGDLSEFNILMQNGRPVFIDFSQSCSVEAGNAPELLKRDLSNMCKFFKKLDVDVPSVSEIFDKITLSKK
jgi:RIO kinase 1